jgi:hypothetical protein
MTRAKSKSSEHHGAAEPHGSELLASSTVELLRERARPLLEHTVEMLKSRPYLTVGASVGVGFLLGVAVVGRFGRLVVMGAASLGAELLRDAAKEQLHAERSQAPMTS